MSRPVGIFRGRSPALVTVPRALLAVGLALVLGGCGSSKKAPPPRTLSASTVGGLSYSLRVTTDGDKQCVASNYRTASAPGGPILQGSRLCARPELPGHPVLVQAHASRESMITDVVATCGPVRGGATHASLRLLVSHCVPGTPAFRVTILPALRRIVIVGVPKVPVINFSRHTCRTGLCITPLA